MMDSDIALARDVGDVDAVKCTFRGGDNPCSRDTPFATHVQRYSSSTK
jgi:hypothetical protein